MFLLKLAFTCLFWAKAAAKSKSKASAKAKGSKKKKKAPQAKAKAAKTKTPYAIAKEAFDGKFLVDTFAFKKCLIIFFKPT